MLKNSKLRVVLSFVGVLIFVILLGLVISNVFGGLSEKKSEEKVLIISEDMKISEIADKNEVKIEIIKEALKIKNVTDDTKSLKEMGLSVQLAEQSISKQLKYAAEEASKNPVVIIGKFLMWFVFMGIAFKLLRKGAITNKGRFLLLFLAFTTTGVILGSEPNPMSTVSDVISGYAIKGFVFVPRIIAMLVLMSIVYFANKFVCSWACQGGTLQEFIFRLNRHDSDKKGIFRQFKVPFVFSNMIRIIFFVVFAVIAFVWSIDILEGQNIFTLFKPAVLGTTSIVIILSFLIASLFVYRPWCHFVCPFGLVGWLVEKVSVFKVKIDYNTCIGCLECTKACPSNVMSAILKQDKITIPDCFSCGSCINKCPTKSISFDKGNRNVIPVDKFDGQDSNN